MNEIRRMFDGCNLFKVQYFTDDKYNNNRKKHAKSDSRLTKEKYLDTCFQNEVESKQ